MPLMLRASDAPSGVTGDSLPRSKNHEAIPCIERALSQRGSTMESGNTAPRGHLTRVGDILLKEEGIKRGDIRRI